MYAQSHKHHMSTTRHTHTRCAFMTINRPKGQQKRINPNTKSPYYACMCGERSDAGGRRLRRRTLSRTLQGKCLSYYYIRDIARSATRVHGIYGWVEAERASNMTHRDPPRHRFPSWILRDPFGGLTDVVRLACVWLSRVRMIIKFNYVHTPFTQF